jgi:quercetin dioxygenase-like cupin family protein
MSLITSESAATAIASVAQHLNWTDIPVEHPAEGIERQMVVGERIMIVALPFVPFLVTPEHTHTHEQMSLVVSGRVRFFVEGMNALLHPETFCTFHPNCLAWRDYDGRRSCAHRHLLADPRRLSQLTMQSLRLANVRSEGPSLDSYRREAVGL